MAHASSRRCSCLLSRLTQGCPGKNQASDIDVFASLRRDAVVAKRDSLRPYVVSSRELVNLFDPQPEPARAAHHPHPEERSAAERLDQRGVTPAPLVATRTV